MNKRELEKTNKRLVELIHSQSDVITELKNVIDRMQSGPSNDKTYECSRGDWCRACIHNKRIGIDYDSDFRPHYVDICVRCLSCREFTPHSDIRKGGD